MDVYIEHAHGSAIVEVRNLREAQRHAKKRKGRLYWRSGKTVTVYSCSSRLCRRVRQRTFKSILKARCAAQDAPHLEYPEYPLYDCGDLAQSMRRKGRGKK